MNLYLIVNLAFNVSLVVFFLIKGIQVEPLKASQLRLQFFVGDFKVKLNQIYLNL